LVLISVIVTFLEVTFGTTVSATFLPALGATCACALVGYGCYQLCVYASNQIDTANEPETVTEDEEKPSEANAKRRPRYCGKELGADQTKSPGEGFEWKGRGRPETGKGQWVKNDGLPIKESLHPDFDHPPPKGPHWDYVGPDGRARLNLDGTWEWK
jgi:hypothetical protein